MMAASRSRHSRRGLGSLAWRTRGDRAAGDAASGLLVKARMLARAYLFATIAALPACAASSGAGGTEGLGGGSSAGTSGTVGASGSGGGTRDGGAAADGAAGSATDPLAPLACVNDPSAPKTVSTIHGKCFDAWNGQTAHWCLRPLQFFDTKCGDTVIVNGQFDVTAAVCIASTWAVEIGTGSSAVNCGKQLGAQTTVTLTPLDCTYPPGSSLVPGSMGLPGGDGGFVACEALADAGTGD
jgi:hypothetical protein